jgi:hypothetical protein
MDYIAWGEYRLCNYTFMILLCTSTFCIWDNSTLVMLFLWRSYENTLFY